MHTILPEYIWITGFFKRSSKALAFLLLDCDHKGTRVPWCLKTYYLNKWKSNTPDMIFSHGAMLEWNVVLHWWVSIRMVLCFALILVTWWCFDMEQSLGTLVVLRFVKATRVAVPKTETVQWRQWPNYAATLIARLMGPTWGSSGANRTQVGPMLAPWTLLSGTVNNMAANVVPTEDSTRGIGNRGFNLILSQYSVLSTRWVAPVGGIQKQVRFLRIKRNVFCLCWYMDLNHVSVWYVLLGYRLNDIQTVMTPIYDFKHIYFKSIIQNSSLNTHCESAFMWMPETITNEKSKLAQAIAWCRQATSH